MSAGRLLPKHTAWEGASSV